MPDQPLSLFITGGCTFEGKPFCHVRMGDREGSLTPAEVRALALGWLAAAEASEQDAMVVAELTDPTGVALPIDLAGAVVAGIRTRRGQIQGLGEIDQRPENMRMDQRDDG
ncbi:MAG: hypothetical protein E6J90_36750 [Deltaproteobacteria bacterium]|nr:MAG: hypothetical protein E6J90_36750 [Deltaproteobacteria bacterium]